MIPRGAIAQLAKMVGHDLARGKPSQGALAAGPMLAAAGATPALVSCLFNEARRKRPNDAVIEGYTFILSAALEELRMSANGGDTDAFGEIDRARREVTSAIARGNLSTTVLMLVGGAFAQAELDPGRPLQEAMMRAIETEAADTGEEQGLGELTDHFAQMAKALNHDPFAIHSEISTSGAALPADYRAAMAAAFAASDIPALSEAAIGFVLDPDTEISAAVSAAIIQEGRRKPASSTTVERLVRMRQLLPEGRRPALDAAIRVLRLKAAPPVSSEPQELRKVLASMIDGAGAQSLFALAKTGRRFALASVLVKSGVGVADAWVTDDMTRREADQLVAEIVANAEAVDISVSLMERRITDALCTNLERNTPPPFSLIKVTEILGLGSIHPTAVAPAALMEELLEGLPMERLGPEAVLAAHRALIGWVDTIDTMHSWFEAGEEVDALLRPLKSHKAKVQAMLTQHLPTRRAFWSTQCTWMAATIKESTGDKDRTWLDFALVARAFAGNASLEEFPLAMVIATESVNAFAARSFKGHRG